jgi:hypothetical protein
MRQDSQLGSQGLRAADSVSSQQHRISLLADEVALPGAGCLLSNPAHNLERAAEIDMAVKWQPCLANGTSIKSSLQSHNAGSPGFAAESNAASMSTTPA